MRFLTQERRADLVAHDLRPDAAGAGRLADGRDPVDRVPARAEGRQPLERHDLAVDAIPPGACAARGVSPSANATWTRTLVAGVLPGLSTWTS